MHNMHYLECFVLYLLEYLIKYIKFIKFCYQDIVVFVGEKVCHNCFCLALLLASNISFNHLLVVYH